MDNEILPHVAVQRCRDPDAILEVLHAVNTIGQVVNGDGGPVRIGALQETNRDISSIGWRRNELPGNLSVIPCIRVHVADSLTIQDKLIQRILGQIHMVRVIAAPGVPILTAIGHKHRQGCAIILVSNPASIVAEGLIGRAIIGACASPCTMRYDVGRDPF